MLSDTAACGGTQKCGKRQPQGGCHETQADVSEIEQEELPEGRADAPEEPAIAPDARRLASVASLFSATDTVPCYRPLKAYRAQGGRIVFSSKEGWSDRPLLLSCGKCVGCRLERSRQWALRCVHEASQHERNSFLTLTYNSESLPEGQTLMVSHWQLFAKRLRKRLGAFRFLHCGEYGTENLRPHYHACIFGIDFAFDRVPLRVNSHGDQTWVSKTLSEIWGMGHCAIGALTFDSAAYVARYVMKKAVEAEDASRYVRVDPDTGECWSVRPEYVTMSRRPGIGAEWFKKYHTDVYPSDEVVHEGRRFRPPRYYDTKFAEMCEEEFKKIQARRLDQAEEKKADRTYDRLKVREQVATARVGQLKRNL